MARKVYDRQFKEEACKLVSERGYSVNKAARELGVASMTLQYWLRKRGHAAASVPESNDPQVLKTKIRELERSLRRSEMEKEILKKATAFFASQNP
jgi:transposase